jgi:hypothetical protein
LDRKNIYARHSTKGLAVMLVILFQLLGLTMQAVVGTGYFRFFLKETMRLISTSRYTQPWLQQSAAQSEAKLYQPY